MFMSDFPKFRTVKQDDKYIIILPNKLVLVLNENSYLIAEQLAEGKQLEEIHTSLQKKGYDMDAGVIKFHIKELEDAVK